MSDICGKLLQVFSSCKKRHTVFEQTKPGGGLQLQSFFAPGESREIGCEADRDSR